MKTKQGILRLIALLPIFGFGLVFDVCAADLKKELVVDLGNDVTLQLILIPPSPDKIEPERKGQEEKSVQMTNVKKPYYIGKYEVTQEQWMAVMGKNPSEFTGDLFSRLDPKRPVEMVNFYECQLFVIMLNIKTGQNFSLPTEDEWKYACRAGSKGKFSFGDDEKKLDQYAWYGRNSDRQTHHVGQKKPNAWGVFDMYGNVSEWCFARPGTIKVITDDGEREAEPEDSGIHLGGSFLDSNPELFELKGRTYGDPLRKFRTYGFRLILHPVAEEKDPSRPSQRPSD